MKTPHFLLFALLSSTAFPAYAYLDPGTGSLIIQGVIGAFALAAATVTGWWYKVKSFFVKNNEESADDNSDPIGQEKVPGTIEQEKKD